MESLGRRNMIYNFQEQLNDPRQREANKKCCEYWKNMSYSVEDVSEDSKFFDKGIDLIRTIGNEKCNIDVKCDFQTNKTGNIVFELIEICPIEVGIFKFGWGYNKNIEEINYYLYDSGELIVLNLDKFRQLAFSKFRRAFSSFHITPFRYFTLGILVPLSEIKQHFEIIQLDKSSFKVQSSFKGS